MVSEAEIEAAAKVIWELDGLPAGWPITGSMGKRCERKARRVLEAAEAVRPAGDDDDDLHAKIDAASRARDEAHTTYLPLRPAVDRAAVEAAIDAYGESAFDAGSCSRYEASEQQMLDAAKAMDATRAALLALIAPETEET